MKEFYFLPQFNQRLGPEMGGALGAFRKSAPAHDTPPIEITGRYQRIGGHELGIMQKVLTKENKKKFVVGLKKIQPIHPQPHLLLPLITNTRLQLPLLLLPSLLFLSSLQHSHQFHNQAIHSRYWGLTPPKLPQTTGTRSRNFQVILSLKRTSEHDFVDFFNTGNFRI